MYADVHLSFNNQRNEDNDLDSRSALIKAAASPMMIDSDLRERKFCLHRDNQRTYTLITGNHLFHSGRLSRKSAILSSLLAEPVAEISDTDAAELGIQNGDRIKVTGDLHEVELSIKIRPGSKGGIVFIDENFEDVAVHRFFTRGCFTAAVGISIAITKEK